MVDEVDRAASADLQVRAAHLHQHLETRSALEIARNDGACLAGGDWVADEEERLYEQARADEALRVLHHRPRRGELEAPQAKRAGKGAVVRMADMADELVRQALAIGFIQA